MAQKEIWQTLEFDEFKFKKRYQISNLGRVMSSMDSPQIDGIILKQKEKLLTLLNKIKRNGKKIIGYGASTKGNVLLQWCGIDNKLIDYIYDINKDKNNTFTPGTLIPIYSKIKKINLDLNYFLVLPWHFKNFILKKENPNVNNKKKLIFPLPTLSVNK